MTKFILSRLHSFSHAFSGLFFVARTEKNAWIHLTATVCVVLAGLWLKLAPLEFCVLLLAIAFVWSMECVNTSLEKLVDIISPEYQVLAKLSKDSVAAAVLIAAMTSVIVGILILGKPLLIKLQVIF